MIDNFSLGITHLLMLLAAVMLLRRDDLDHEPRPGEAPARPRKWLKRRPRA